MAMIDEAIQLYEKQIEIPKFSNHLKKHPQYVSMYATKGMLQMDALQSNPTQKQYGSNALNNLERALRLQKGNDAPSVLQTVEIQCHLGRVHCLLNNNKKADELFKNAFDATESKLGKNHPLTATVLANWSRVHYEKNNIKEAIKMLEDAWNIRDSFLRSVKHPNPLLYAYHLAKYYDEIEDDEKAVHWYSVTINGYAYLMSKEDIRVENLKKPHDVLHWNKLPIYRKWHDRIKECRESYDKFL